MSNHSGLLSDASSLQQLFKSMPTQEHAKGEVLIHQSDRIRHFFVITAGYVKVYTIDDDGEEITLLILGPKDIFPLLKNPEQSDSISLYYYETITKVNVGTVSRQELLKRIRSDRQASWALLNYVGEFSSTLTNRLAQLEGRRAEQKLSNIFPYLTRVCGEPLPDGGSRLKVKLTHQDIARLIGTTRETVSREIKKMQSDGSISYDDGYLVVTGKGQA